MDRTVFSTLKLPKLRAKLLDKRQASFWYHVKQRYLPCTVVEAVFAWEAGCTASEKGHTQKTDRQALYQNRLVEFLNSSSYGFNLWLYWVNKYALYWIFVRWAFTSVCFYVCLCVVCCSYTLVAIFLNFNFGLKFLIRASARTSKFPWSLCTRLKRTPLYSSIWQGRGDMIVF